MTTEPTPENDRELVLTRLVDIAPEKLYRCWTEPALLMQWFAPAPFTTPSAELNVYAGGANRITMRSPEGQDMPNEGVYLEV
ncbi:MAG: SRPBCC domain-containing protein, partial [Polyangiales bacterium]